MTDAAPLTQDLGESLLQRGEEVRAARGAQPGDAAVQRVHVARVLERDDPLRAVVEGQHSDEGPSRSEVILGAAERGFVGRGYQRVHTDYSEHAEEVLERDEVPPGYRFYVRRYFQLIRPREAGGGQQ